MLVNGTRWRCTILPALATGRQKSERDNENIQRANANRPSGYRDGLLPQVLQADDRSLQEEEIIYISYNIFICAYSLSGCNISCICPKQQHFFEFYTSLSVQFPLIALIFCTLIPCPFFVLFEQFPSVRLFIDPKAKFLSLLPLLTT